MSITVYCTQCTVVSAKVRERGRKEQGTRQKYSKKSVQLSMASFSMLDLPSWEIKQCVSTVKYNTVFTVFKTNKNYGNFAKNRRNRQPFILLKSCSKQNNLMLTSQEKIYFYHALLSVLHHPLSVISDTVGRRWATAHSRLAPLGFWAQSGQCVL